MKGARWSSPGEIFALLPLLRINARRDDSEVFFQLRQQRDELLDLLLDIFVLLRGVNVRGKCADSWPYFVMIDERADTAQSRLERGESI